MNILYYPNNDFDLIVKFITYFIFGSALFYVETNSKFNMAYSKFRRNNTFSSRIGMFLIYSIPLCVYLYTFYAFNFPNSIYHLICLFLISFHYIKRLIEVLFIHNFSGGMSIVSILIICSFYSNINWILGSLINGLIDPKVINLNEISHLWFGLFISMIGFVGNLYHHLILAKLRNNKADQQYLIPNQGLFKYILCPHYLFEIMIWLGIAIASSFLESYLILFLMISYLSGRGIRTKNWYLKNFANVDLANKKILIPYFF